MVETLQNLALGFSVALTPGVLFYAFVGCVVGTLVGVLPGIGPLAGISLLLPATFGLDATRALVMLAGIYYGAMYGGSTTSILMRIPGEAARKAVGDAEFRGAMARVEMPIAYQDADEFKAWWDKDAQILAGVIKRIGKVAEK